MTGEGNIKAGGAAARLVKFVDGPAKSQVTPQEGRLWRGGFVFRTALLTQEVIAEWLEQVNDCAIISL